MWRRKRVIGDSYTMPTKRGLSEKMYKDAVEWQRWYKVMYDEQADGKLRLKGVTFIERDGSEGFMTIGDIVEFVFVQLDLDRMEAETDKQQEIDALTDIIESEKAEKAKKTK